MCGVVLKVYNSFSTLILSQGSQNLKKLLNSYSRHSPPVIWEMVKLQKIAVENYKLALAMV
jgi:hypothetical protein